MLNTDVSGLLRRLENQKQEILSAAVQMSTERLTFRPGEQQWSTLDVLSHLAKVETGFSASLRQGLNGTHAVSASEKVRGWCIIALMRSPVKVRMPAEAMPYIAPDTAIELDDVIADWNRARQELLQLLQSAGSNAQLGVFRHPVSGWMSLPDALAFLYAHTRHHVYQLKRLQRASRGL
jgi:uncharacterized damage-inducible protein DinB